MYVLPAEVNPRYQKSHLHIVVTGFLKKYTDNDDGQALASTTPAAICRSNNLPQD